LIDPAWPKIVVMTDAQLHHAVGHDPCVAQSLEEHLLWLVQFASQEGLGRGVV